MTLIEGVGDEVVQFVAALAVVGVGMLAWWSTNARPDRYRTVLVMRSRAHPVTVSIRPSPRPATIVASTVATVSTPASTSETNASTEEAPRDSSRVIPLQEMDSIVDADMAMMDNNRLHFYRRIDSPHTPLLTPDSSGDEVEEERTRAGAAQMQEMDSIVSAMEADVTARDLFPPANSSRVPAKDGSNGKDAEPAGAAADAATPDAADTADADADAAARKILIKLKYLNDTLKEVEGSLDELLKDFKWRHFSVELSAESRVRLIFNGRVLLDDGLTLRACGLHDRAVVHCLVHPKRVVPAQTLSTEETGTTELVTEGTPPERAWDLENILMTLVSVALTVVWFFRCEYSNMFTASASVALFGLTVFYSVAIFGLYLSDTFHFERRPQPVPNN
ncbi:transmembrane and ubiquitin-like domain-containing protein 1 isoform X2 [Leguminivora glycinivorella]|uniref:transmembrane and ubiquitin-like domain-containing protein 1 isoform X2 n=1 Tax=Leguminivora glycinivorella TaxID=1035111 RepID=UPI00200D4CE8|nr:transmembrane and ubiquitin-like domain-containing protein 1 isoform X2 [Leguminivora glycinivorella]